MIPELRAASNALQRMFAMELLVFGTILLGIATVVAIGQQLHASPANVSWWPL